MAAIDKFNHDNPPKASLAYYTRITYVRWGLIS